MFNSLVKNPTVKIDLILGDLFGAHVDFAGPTGPPSEADAFFSCGLNVSTVEPPDPTSAPLEVDAFWR